MMSYSWKINVYKTWEEVDNQKFYRQIEKWLDSDPEPNVFNHPLLIKVWIDIYRKIQKISPLYIVAETDDIKLFLPLIIWKRNWKNAFIRMIIPVGYSDYDYHNPISSKIISEDIYVSFWHTIKEYIYLKFKNEFDIINIPGLCKQGIGLEWKNDIDICPYLDLKRYENYNDYYIKLKKNLRVEINRKKRRISENGNLSLFKYDTLHVDEAIDSMLIFLDQHKKRWPNAYKPEGFHTMLIKYGLSAGLINYSELRVDNEVINWNLCFLYKQSLYGYMTAFADNKKYIKNAPGSIHLSYLIEDSFESGIHVFDFLRGEEGYKNGWTNEKKNLFNFKSESDNKISKLKILLVNKKYK
jgi:CelD/BcsL family acetyltransferase involved in cellulose biosynthesis